MNPPDYEPYKQFGTPLPAAVDRADYWENRYQEGTARWDLGQPAPAFAAFLRERPAPPSGRTIVLGCGRGHDVLAFARAGYDCLGIDFAPSAIVTARAAAAAAGIAAEFWQCDIFDLPARLSEGSGCIVEHTCFCALPPPRRQDYITLVRDLLHPGGEFVGIFFTHGRAGGPPFGTSPAEIRELFSPYFAIERLEPAMASVPGRKGEEYFGHFRRYTEESPS